MNNTSTQLENIINQSMVSELKIGDHIRSEEMTIFQKVIKLDQDPYFSNCLRITLDKQNEWGSDNFVERFVVINKTQFVEFRKELN
jgi:hypothetical protein